MSQPGAECRIHDEIRRRKPLGCVKGVNYDGPYASLLQPLGGHPTVGAVGTRAGEHHHPPAVATTQLLEYGPCHRGSGTSDQDVYRLRGSRIDLGHLSRGDNRNHDTAALRARPVTEPPPWPSPPGRCG